MNDSNQRISVIIPTYNRRDLIGRSIQSVLSQTYEHFELLIIDDGSTDDTYNVVESFQDDRIRYIKCEKNQGVSSARNRGIQEAKYDLIAFQDSDDVWETTKLERQIELMTDDIGLVYCNYFYHPIDNGEGKIVPDADLGEVLKHGNMFPQLLVKNMIGTPTILCRKSILIEVGMFDASLPCLEDYDLVLKIAKRHKIAHVDEVLVQAHATFESVTNQVGNYFYVSCLLIGKYQNELAAIDFLNDKIEVLYQKAEQLNCLKNVQAMMEKVLALTKNK